MIAHLWIWTWWWWFWLTASPPLPPPPADDHAHQFDYMGSLPPPQNFIDRREGPPSTREGRMIGSVPEDLYAANQGIDDPYAATGPQLLSQPSWIPKHYLEKGKFISYSRGVLWHEKIALFCDIFFFLKWSVMWEKWVGLWHSKKEKNVLRWSLILER